MGVAMAREIAEIRFMLGGGGESVLGLELGMDGLC
jgi:hypothetical protein